jgi:hypothetical protein
MKDPLRTKEEIDSYTIIWGEAQSYGKQSAYPGADSSQSRGEGYQPNRFPSGNGAPRRGGYGGGGNKPQMGGAYGGGYGGAMGNYYNYPTNM